MRLPPRGGVAGDVGVRHPLEPPDLPRQLPAPRHAAPELLPRRARPLPLLQDLPPLRPGGGGEQRRHEAGPNPVQQLVLLDELLEHVVHHVVHQAVAVVADAVAAVAVIAVVAVAAAADDGDVVGGGGEAGDAGIGGRGGRFQRHGSILEARSQGFSLVVLGRDRMGGFVWTVEASGRQKKT